MTRHRSHWIVQLAIGCAAVVASLGLSTRLAVTGHAGGRIAGSVEEPAPLRADVLRESTGTYIRTLLLERDSTLSRWPARVADPIRVWIEPTGMLGFNDRVRSAFTEWTGTGVPLRFVFVPRARDAEIRVRWTDHLDHKTGNTVWRVDRNGWMQGSDVVLATHLSDGRVLDVRSLRAIALHEVGHAIGLAHSNDRHDVMASLVRVASLSDEDRATARLLYALPAGRVR